MCPPPPPDYPWRWTRALPFNSALIKWLYLPDFFVAPKSTNLISEYPPPTLQPTTNPWQPPTHGVPCPPYSSPWHPPAHGAPPTPAMDFGGGGGLEAVFVQSCPQGGEQRGGGRTWRSPTPLGWSLTCAHTLLGEELWKSLAPCGRSLVEVPPPLGKRRGLGIATPTWGRSLMKLTSQWMSALGCPTPWGWAWWVPRPVLGREVWPTRAPPTHPSLSHVPADDFALLLCAAQQWRVFEAERTEEWLRAAGENTDRLDLARDPHNPTPNFIHCRWVLAAA